MTITETYNSLNETIHSRCRSALLRVLRRGGSALAADAAPVKVFDATELALDRYTVVKRIWTQTWRSAFWVSNYDNASDAIAALTSKAADEGANGVIDLNCLNDTGGWVSGYFCYGLAIKLK